MRSVLTSFLRTAQHLSLRCWKCITERNKTWRPVEHGTWNRTSKCSQNPKNEKRTKFHSLAFACSFFRSFAAPSAASSIAAAAIRSSFGARQQQPWWPWRRPRRRRRVSTTGWRWWWSPASTRWAMGPRSSRCAAARASSSSSPITVPRFASPKSSTMPCFPRPACTITAATMLTWAPLAASTSESVVWALLTPATPTSSAPCPLNRFGVFTFLETGSLFLGFRVLVL